MPTYYSMVGGYAMILHLFRTGGGLGESLRQETLRYAVQQPGERVLDVGGGTGVLTRMAAAVVGPVGWVVGIDPALMMLARARDNAVLAGKWLACRLAARELRPFADQTFDVVLASFVLHPPPQCNGPGCTRSPGSASPADRCWSWMWTGPRPGLGGSSREGRLHCSRCCMTTGRADCPPPSYRPDF